MPPLTFRSARPLIAFAMLALLGACSDEGPVSGPGTLTATLTSPHGADGAALIVLVGEGLGAVMPVGATEAWASAADGATRVILDNPGGGELSFRIELADTTRLPRAVIHQVAAPNDTLRSVSDYSLAFGR